MNDRAPLCGVFEAKVESGSLDRNYVVVDTDFAANLQSDHTRTFEVRGDAGLTRTRDVPNTGDEALSVLDDRGIVKVDTEVAPGAYLVGLVEELDDHPPSPEEALLRAIFGEAPGNLRDVSLRVPPGFYGRVVEADPVGPDGARVVIGWKRLLEVGDLLQIDGEPVVVAAIRHLQSDIAWKGGPTARVTKTATARDVIHARSIGPYAGGLVDQPLEGRDAFGGQRLSHEQAVALAKSAPWVLWEMYTFKSDHSVGRPRAYEAIYQRENPNLLPATAPSEPGGFAP